MTAKGELKERLETLEAEMAKPTLKAVLKEIGQLHYQRNIMRLKIRALEQTHIGLKKRLEISKADYERFKKMFEKLRSGVISTGAIYNLNERERLYQTAKTALHDWEQKNLDDLEVAKQELQMVEDQLIDKKALASQLSKEENQ